MKYVMMLHKLVSVVIFVTEHIYGLCGLVKNIL
jgi:hypothetical protein